MKRATFRALALTVLVALAAFAVGGCASKKMASKTGGGSGPDGDEAPAPTMTDSCTSQAKEFFRSELWEPILSVRCIGCHNATGLASTTHMVFEPESVANSIDQNYATFSSVARIQYNGTPVLLLRPEGLYPTGHGGGTLILQGSQEYLKLKAFVDVANSGSCSPFDAVECDPTKTTAGHRVLRRLTNFEYDNTLRDLLGVAPKYGALFPPDDVVAGFDDIASAQHVAPIYTDKARAAAEEVGGTVDLTNLLSCDVTAGDATCAKTFITTFGAKAFRRPLTDAELARYTTLETTIAGAEGFEGGIRATLMAMLQSTGFLYRTEIGTANGANYTLSPYEVASELSYLLTESMPDAELASQAASGALVQPATLATETQRLLQTDSAKAALQHFVEQWLLLDRLPIAVKDPTVYPQFTPALVSAMHDESVAYFVNTLRAPNASFQSLLLGTTTYANDTLAQFYGFGDATGPADPNGLKPYALPSGRSGFLTEAGLLATQAKPDRPSPVLRGELVRVQLLCQALPPPPAGVNTQLPPVDPNVPNRQRFTAHSANQPCQSCHQLMDPIGFGFEGFDGIGRPVPGSIDTSGQIVGTNSTNGPFNGVPNLASILAGSPDAQNCFALQMYRSAYGIDDTTDDSCGESKAAADFQSAKLSLSGLILSLVQANHFLTRVPDADVGAPVPPLPVDDAGVPEGGVMTPPALVDGGTTGGSVMSNAQFSVMQQSSWATGYCNNVTVTNSTSAPISWTVAIPAQGMLTNTWSATEQTSGSQWVFTGMSYNSPVTPGSTASFGFCASL
jgi:hypothetical protein